MTGQVFFQKKGNIKNAVNNMGSYLKNKKYISLKSGKE